MKSGGKPVFVLFDSLVLNFRRHLVKLRQIGVKHHFLAPDENNPLLDPLGRNDLAMVRHRTFDVMQLTCPGIRGQIITAV